MPKYAELIYNGFWFTPEREMLQAAIDASQEFVSGTVRLKLYKGQIPVIEQAIETAARMLGSDKSRGYCLEMICADFLAGANLEGGTPDVLVRSVSRLLQLLPAEEMHKVLTHVRRTVA